MINKIIDKKEVFSMKMIKKHLILFTRFRACRGYYSKKRSLVKTSSPFLSLPVALYRIPCVTASRLTFSRIAIEVSVPIFSQVDRTR